MAAARLPVLAAQWLLLAQMLIAFARRFSRLSQAGVRGAEARAEAFEIELRCAAMILSKQIAEADAQNETDRRALETLCAVRSALLAVAMIAAKMRAELAAHSQNNWAWANLSFAPQFRAFAHQKVMHQIICIRPYFDSG